MTPSKVIWERWLRKPKAYKIKEVRVSFNDGNSWQPLDDTIDIDGLWGDSESHYSILLAIKF
jgi:hypothetical protein